MDTVIISFYVIDVLVQFCMIWGYWCDFGKLVVSLGVLDYWIGFFLLFLFGFWGGLDSLDVEIVFMRFGGFLWWGLLRFLLYLLIMFGYVFLYFNSLMSDLLLILLFLIVLDWLIVLNLIILIPHLTMINLSLFLRRLLWLLFGWLFWLLFGRLFWLLFLIGLFWLNHKRVIHLLLIKQFAFLFFLFLFAGR